RTVALRGAGCSYGDASLNRGEDVVDVGRMARILSFDEETGVADCEAGVTIRDLWRHALPRGHWPRVVSGTMFPTLAGAAGMNIHGKNNFKVGTIGDAILDLDFLRADGTTLRLSRDENPELFHAVVGGFGMLGAITRVRIRTKRIHSGDVEVRGVSTPSLGGMMEYVDAHKDEADYLVGWIDCFAGGKALGRGLVHHARNLAEGADARAAETLTIEHQELPGSILGFPKAEVWRVLKGFSWNGGMRALNFVKHQMGKLEQRKGWYRQSHAGFNFLLDYVPNWKFAYGRAPGTGLVQYQAFLPHATAREAFERILELGRSRGHTSFLGVLKRHRPDPFLLTHGLDGWSLALDFPVSPANRDSFLRAAEEWTAVVLDRGGRFYFAKDAVLGPGAVRRMYDPAALKRFLALKDEHDPDGLFQSDLSRRVLGEGDALVAADALRTAG
ncbi:MAG: FAD-binding oxidoreductase, partial [Planctomycetota bacterium]